MGNYNYILQRIYVGGTIWSQLATEASSFLQLALGPQFLIDPSVLKQLDFLRPAHINFAKKNFGGNAWSQMVTKASNLLLLALRALLLLDFSFLNKNETFLG